MTSSEAALLAEIHARIEAFYDIDGWHWNEETSPFDVCLGCILVQHTSWSNVEHALANLRAAGALSLEQIDALSDEELAALVRPVGTPLTKARRLQSFTALARDAGGVVALLALPEPELRARLLRTSGIGPETADAILLYAAHYPAVVHDAYTLRLFRRLGIGPSGNPYGQWRAWLDERLPTDVTYRWRHHAGIVMHCKATCRARPRCSACPLVSICVEGKQQGLTIWDQLGSA